MELTEQKKVEIMEQARFFTGATNTYFHKFANKEGHMLVIETTNLEGFKLFLRWMDILSKNEPLQIDVIRTVPEGRD